jgi:hypothetical protein
MSKLKIEHGISRVRRVKLQTHIDQTVADDIQLMAEQTNNEQQYVVNELLRFALTQSEDFQQFKLERGTKDSRTTGNAKSVSPVSTTAPNPAQSLPKASSPPSAKPTALEDRMTPKEK